MIFNSYFQTTILIRLLWPSSLSVCLKTLMRMWNEIGFLICNKLTYFENISVKSKLFNCRLKNWMNYYYSVLLHKPNVFSVTFSVLTFLVQKVNAKQNSMLNRSKLRTLIHLTGSILGTVFFIDIWVTNLFKSMEMAYGN